MLDLGFLIKYLWCYLDSYLLPEFLAVNNSFTALTIIAEATSLNYLYHICRPINLLLIRY